MNNEELNNIKIKSQSPPSNGINDGNFPPTSFFQNKYQINIEQPSKEQEQFKPQNNINQDVTYKRII